VERVSHLHRPARIQSPASARSRIESLQPFHRGASYKDDPLWKLNELNNTDKHRTLIVTALTLAIGNRDLKFDDVPLKKGAQMVFLLDAPVKDDQIFGWIETAKPEVNIKGKVTADVAVEKIGTAILLPDGIAELFHHSVMPCGQIGDDLVEYQSAAAFCIIPLRVRKTHRPTLIHKGMLVSPGRRPCG
jgi:hypothetical protein